MANMCLSGTTLSVISAVFSLCATLEWLPQHLNSCILTHILTSSCAAVSMSTSTALALDRLCAVIFHLRYKVLASRTKVTVFIIFQVNHL